MTNHFLHLIKHTFFMMAWKAADGTSKLKKTKSHVYGDKSEEVATSLAFLLCLETADSPPRIFLYVSEYIYTYE